MVLLFKTNIAIWHQVHCCTSGYSILLSRSVPTSAWSFHQSNHSVPAIVWISPSVPPLPAYRCKGRLLYRPSPAPARLFLVPAARTLSFPFTTFSACHSGARGRSFPLLAFPPLCRAALSPRASHDNRSSYPENHECLPVP